MRWKRCRAPWAIVVFALVVSAVAPAATVSLCDFRTPTTDVTHLFLTMDYTYLNLPDTAHVDVSSGRFSFTFSHIHDEADRALNVGSTSEFSFDHLQLDRTLGDAYLTTRFYFPREESLYVFAEVKADYTSAASLPGLELRLGSGYGRLTDVTPLAKAMRVEESLIGDLVLPSPLPDDALQEIAQLIGREPEFSGIGELVSRIEGIIEAETSVTLNARSLLAIAERIRSTDVSRQCGWATQLGFGYELLRRFGDSRQLLLTLSTDLVRPLSLESQVEVHGDASRALFIPEASALSTSMLFSRRLSEAARLVAEYALQRVQLPGREPSVGETIELQLMLDLGPIDLTASGSLNRGTGMTGWVESLVVAVRVDLL